MRAVKQVWACSIGCLRPLPLVLVLIGAPLLAAAPAQAARPWSQAPSAIEISAVAGYGFAGGGNYRLNGPSLLRPNDVWVPVHVSLRNDGTSDVSGQLVIPDDGPQQNGSSVSYRTDYTLDVTLPAGARKAVTMYVRASDLSSTSQLPIDFNAAGTALASTSATPAPLSAGNLSVGVLSDGTTARTIFQNVKMGPTPLSVVQFNDATPLDTQPAALDNFDLIIVTDYSSDTLSGAQLAALRAWVQGGGTLLVAGGPTAQKTMGHLPADLLAATLSSPAPDTAPALPEVARIAGTPPSVGGPFEYSVATPRRGATVLAAHNAVPLVVDLPAGRGHLVYSALDPALAPLNPWTSTAQSVFWAHLLAPALRGSLDTLVENENNGPNTSNFGSGAPNSLASDLSTLPSRSLPSLPFYTFLIVLYVLVLGPGNFVLLRWRRRLEWSWITIPVLAVVFGAGSFGLAYTRNGGDILANVDTVVYLDPGPLRLADSYLGIFVPFRGDYDVAMPGSALAWPLSDNNNGPSGGSSTLPLGLRVSESSPFGARLFGLQMWSMRTLGVEQLLNVPGQVSGDLALSGAHVGGTVTNRTHLELHDGVIVAANGASARLPVLAPGQTVRVAPFSLSNAAAANTSPNGNPNFGGNTGPLGTLYNAAAGGTGLQAAGPRTLVSTARYNNILNTLFPGGSISSAATPLYLIAWSTQPLGQLTVNGATPHRTDLDLIIVPLQLRARPGRFTVQPGDLPVGVVGTTVAMAGGTGTGGSLTLNPNDYLDLQLVLPSAGHGVRVDTLTLQVSLNSGPTLCARCTALWNWTTHRWESKDVSSGSLTLARHAAAYVSGDGRVLLRILVPNDSAITNLTFNSNFQQSVQIGATGVVR